MSTETNQADVEDLAAQVAGTILAKIAGAHEAEGNDPFTLADPDVQLDVDKGHIVLRDDADILARFKLEIMPVEQENEFVHEAAKLLEQLRTDAIGLEWYTGGMKRLMAKAGWAPEWKHL